MRSEQRQHISLNNHAYVVVESDLSSMKPDSTLSGFLNDIFSTYIKQLRASTALHTNFHARSAGTN